jgi:hypothetical protein
VALRANESVSLVPLLEKKKTLVAVMLGSLITDEVNSYGEANSYSAGQQMLRLL